MRTLKKTSHWLIPAAFAVALGSALPTLAADREDVVAGVLIGAAAGYILSEHSGNLQVGVNQHYPQQHYHPSQHHHVANCRHFSHSHPRDYYYQNRHRDLAYLHRDWRHDHRDDWRRDGHQHRDYDHGKSRDYKGHGYNSEHGSKGNSGKSWSNGQRDRDGWAHR